MNLEQIASSITLTKLYSSFYFQMSVKEATKRVDSLKGVHKQRRIHFPSKQMFYSYPLPNYLNKQTTAK